MTNSINPFSPRNKETSLSFTQEADNGVILLENPSPSTINFALLTLPFEPRWTATFDCISPDAQGESMVYAGPLGQLRSRRKDRFRKRFEEIFPEEEIAFALDQKPKRIVFQDSIFRNNSSYLEFLKQWLATLTKNGFKMTSMKLADHVDTRGISLDHPLLKIVSGVTIEDDALKVIYCNDHILTGNSGDTLPGQGIFPSIVPEERMKSWFDAVIATPEAKKDAAVKIYLSL